MTKKRSTKTTSPAKKQSPLVWVLAIGAILVAAFAVTQLLPATAGDDAAETGAVPREVSVAQAAELREAGAFVLDVREPSEWEQAHVPDSTLIPLGQLSSRMSEVPTDQQVVIICRSGNRSAQARDLLLNAGFTNVTSIAGGIIDWQAQGQPTVSGR